MKITIDNIEEFKPYLGKSKAADAGFDFIVENGDLYDDDDTIKETIDKSLQLINKIVSENAPKKKPLKHKFTKGNGKRKVVGRRKKGEKKSEPKKPKKKAKTSSTTKKTTTKTEKQTKTKKQPKKKVGEAAPWQATLRRFAGWCGKERTVTAIRKFVKEIQANFSAKLRKKTPHIEIIREIQEKLLPYANKTNVVKVQIPAWADFKAQCQAAAKEWTVSKTVEKPEIKETALSGLKKK